MRHDPSRSYSKKIVTIRLNLPQVGPILRLIAYNQYNISYIDSPLYNTFKQFNFEANPIEIQSLNDVHVLG